VPRPSLPTHLLRLCETAVVLALVCIRIIYTTTTTTTTTTMIVTDYAAAAAAAAELTTCSQLLIFRAGTDVLEDQKSVLESSQVRA